MSYYVSGVGFEMHHITSGLHTHSYKYLSVETMCGDAMRMDGQENIDF